MLTEWKDLIRPSTVNLIVGQKGKGKSGLAYYLMETIAPLYKLLPVVVNFPREKQGLLPDGYVIKELEDALVTESAFILVDEGTTQLPAGTHLEEFIKACSSLSRQRQQIILFVFHASRDVGSRIMRGLDVIMVKEPSRRQIEQGSKDSWFKALLVEARRAIRAERGDPREWAYVDSEEPEFRGVLKNELPSFWSEELSMAWRGVALRSVAEETAAVLGALLGSKGPQCLSCKAPVTDVCACHGHGFCHSHLLEHQARVQEALGPAEGGA